MVRFRRARHERPLLGQELDAHRLQLFGVAADRPREAAVSDAPHEAPEPEEQKAGQLQLSAREAAARRPPTRGRNPARPVRPVAFSEAPTSTIAAAAPEKPIRR